MRFVSRLSKTVQKIDAAFIHKLRLLNYVNIYSTLVKQCA